MWQSSGQKHFHNMSVPTSFSLAVPIIIPNIALTHSKNV